MKKYLIRVLSLLLSAVFLAGCSFGPGAGEMPDGNGIRIDKNGKLTQLIVEDFSQSYYNAEELKGQIEQKIAEVGGSGDEAKIRLKDYTLSEDKNLRVTIEYDTAGLYADFNQRELFCGTVAEAVAAGYVLPEMKTPEDTALSPETLSGMGDAKIVVFEEAMQVITPTEIKGIGTDLVLAAPNKAVKPEEDESIGFVIY
ncbi:MAG: hypothetical protein K6E18_02755 [Lachnospiraceae bacterium]|nr:hypothetical protein [Lachnospiraceae bacterium]